MSDRDERIEIVRAALQATDDDTAWNAFNELLAELDAATAREQAAIALNREWLAANAPGGWIDDLRVRLTTLEQALWR